MIDFPLIATRGSRFADRFLDTGYPDLPQNDH
jgi:hypothetical protein